MFLEISTLLGLTILALTIIKRFKFSEKVIKEWKRTIFASWYARLKRFERQSANCRKELLSELKSTRSSDPELRKEGPGVLRVLEIGVGPCFNLAYYPDNTRLIIVEPNKHFEPVIREKLAKHPHIQLEKSYRCEAEDMSRIPDKSVDVVVDTFVFCSVVNADKVLDEIHRVLVDGGKFLFAEHVASESTWLWLLQVLIQPFWYFVGDDCRLTQPMMAHLRRSKLQLLEHRVYTNREISNPLINQLLIGKAIKP